MLLVTGLAIYSLADSAKHIEKGLLSEIFRISSEWNFFVRMKFLFFGGLLMVVSFLLNRKKAVISHASTKRIKGPNDIFRGERYSPLLLHTGPASQYVIRLRAFNHKGEGMSVYENVFTREPSGNQLQHDIV